MTALPPPPSYGESVDQQSTGPYPQQSCIDMTCEQTIHPPLPGRYGEGIGRHVISNPVYPPNPTDFNGEAGEHCGGESGGYDNSNAAYPPFPINSETSNQQMEMTAVQSTNSHSIEVKDATASVLNNPSSNVVQWQPTGPPAQFDDDPCDTCKEIGFCFLLFITIPLWFPVWFCYYILNTNERQSREEQSESNGALKWAVYICLCFLLVITIPLWFWFWIIYWVFCDDEI